MEKIRTKFNYNGVLLATDDGLPIVSAVAKDIDVQVWSRLAPLLYRKWDTEEGASSLGKASRVIVSSGGLWFSIYQENGMYLIVIHPLSTLQKEFEERNQALINEISRQHVNQLKAT